MESKNLAVPVIVFVVFGVCLAVALSGVSHSEEHATTQPSTGHSVAHGGNTPATTHAAAHDDKVLTLFDGKSMGNWKPSEFGGDGPVLVEDGKIIVKTGSSLSGITWKGTALPTENYEIEFDAMKLEGSDFFVGLTFPYKKDFGSIILGGWGGSLVGISSVNGNDAANNEYSSTKEFKKGQWYHVRLRTTPAKIQVWLDNSEDPILDVETTDRNISTRADIDAARPLGLSTYQTSAAYKNIILRKL